MRKQATWKALPIALMGKLLERRGSVHRAPDFALVEVTDTTAQDFMTSVSRLAADFDYVVALWRASAPSPALPKSFKVVEFSEQFQTRWSLLQHCAAGFVFPVRAGESKNLAQQKELKAQLFAHGGNCIVGYANLKQHLDLEAPLATDFRGPILVASVDVNQVVFDQRFLKIRPAELSPATEVQDLVALAKARQTPILAIDSQDLAEQTQSLKFDLPHEKSSKSSTRSELIETLIRMPNLAKQMNVRTARLWNTIWLALGYETRGEVTTDQVRALAIHRATTKPSNTDIEKAKTTLKILGAAK